ncbi:hypothetical protein TNCV_3200211 [Trichonephila clavipes]|nr:hypothetical protein TNCV_3200211 [Trichonephila clavipes]
MKYIVPSSYKSFREVGGRGREKWEVPDHPQNLGGIEPNRTVTCMVLKAEENDRRKSSPLPSMNFVALDLMLISVTIDQPVWNPRYETAHSTTCLGPVCKALFLIRVLDSWSASRNNTLGFSSPLPQKTIPRLFRALFLDLSFRVTFLSPFRVLSSPEKEPF